MTPADIARVGELLGRVPQGQFEIVIRTKSGDPVVLRNAHFSMTERQCQRVIGYWANTKRSLLDDSKQAVVSIKPKPT